MKRAQAAWGTMEILIAVIILGMSMTIVAYYLGSVQDTQCIVELRAETSSLKSAMLEVSLGAPPTRKVVPYKFPSCAGKKVTALRFVYYKSAKFCGSCPGVYNGCWIIQPTYKDLKTNMLYDMVDASACVNMPADIDINFLDASSEVRIGDKTYNCLGNEYYTTNPCLPGQPCTDGSKSNVPSSVFNYGTSVSCGDSAQMSCWKTFSTVSSAGARAPDFVNFVFSKSLGVSGKIPVVQVCPVNPRAPV